MTGPVSKEAIRRCGIPFSGHTEYLGQMFSAKPYMVFLTGSMPVALLSTHLPFRDIAASITREALEGFVRGLAQAWHRQLNSRPRFRVAGLNPHAGEGGLLGREEREVIEPAIEALIAEGIEVEGPVPADSLFLRLGGARHDRRGALPRPGHDPRQDDEPGPRRELHPGAALPPHGSRTTAPPSTSPARGRRTRRASGAPSWKAWTCSSGGGDRVLG